MAIPATVDAPEEVGEKPYHKVNDITKHMLRVHHDDMWCGHTLSAYIICTLHMARLRGNKSVSLLQTIVLQL